MFKVLRKKSSPDKSASLARNSSLRSTSNDTSTGTDPVSTNEFGYFQGRLETLNQLYGDIQKIGTDLDPSSYTAAQSKYKILYDEIKKDTVLQPKEKVQLLFKIYEYQAISAFRAKDLSKHNEHLLHAYDKYSPDRDKSIIELERWVERYETLGEDAQKVPSIFPRYNSLLKEVETEVQSLIKTDIKTGIKTGKYEEARAKMKYLNENSKSFHIPAIYAKILIKQADDLKDAGNTSEAKEYYENAYQYCQSKLFKDEDVQHDVIHDTFKVLEGKLTVVGNTKLAAEAATYASKYKPNPVKILIEQGDDLAADEKTSEAKECYKKAYQYCKSKLSKDEDVPYDVIHDTFKVLAGKFSVVGDTKLAAEATTCASKYKPDPIVATASVVPAVRKAEKEFERLKEKYDEAALKLKTVITLDVHTKQLEELRAKHEAELKAELEKLRTEHKAELEALKPKDSPTQDTKVDEAGDFSPTSSLPPPYSTVDIHSHPYLKIAKNATTTPTAPTAPVVPPLASEVLAEVVPPLVPEVLAEVVPPLASEVLAELTELAQLISSLDYQNSNYGPTKDKAKKLLNEVVKENPDVYKTIDDPKILVLLADVLLSSNKMAEARIVCEKALKIDPDIWKATNDQIVLLNLAGVLLSSSNESKAKEVYSKAISIRIFSKDERGYNQIDNKTTIVSKTVAQDQYTDAERDCLVEVCLSAPKIFQKAQAIDCYPHTYVTKRQDIAQKLQLLGKKTLELKYSAHVVYALYAKAYSALKNDQAFCQDMKKAYDTYLLTTLQHDVPAFHYPPTEDSSTLLVGMCATTDYAL